MSKEPESVKVQIMEREYNIACAPEESESVIAAAVHLNKKIRDVAQGAKVLSAEQRAIMAGLNICHELLALLKVAADGKQFDSRLKSLHERVDVVVANIERAGS